jgi:ABC-type phosphate transport system permease subunit
VPAVVIGVVGSIFLLMMFSFILGGFLSMHLLGSMILTFPGQSILFLGTILLVMRIILSRSWSRECWRRSP